MAKSHKVQRAAQSIGISRKYIKEGHKTKSASKRRRSHKRKK